MLSLSKESCTLTDLCLEGDTKCNHTDLLSHWDTMTINKNIICVSFLLLPCLSHCRYEIWLNPRRQEAWWSSSFIGLISVMEPSGQNRYPPGPAGRSRTAVPLHLTEYWRGYLYNLYYTAKAAPVGAPMFNLVPNDLSHFLRVKLNILSAAN